MEKVVPIIDLPYNTIAPRVLVCGDPHRAERISGQLDNAVCIAKSREYWTYNGTYKGVPVTVSSHGVGGCGASVSFEGLIIGGAKAIVRMGTCGTLQDGMRQGDLIIATAACREDGITQQIVPLSYPAVASAELVMAMQKAAKDITSRTHTGIITTSGIFYKGLLPSNNKVLAQAGVIAMENEASVLFVVGAMHGIKTGCVLAADGPCFEFVGPDGFDHYPDAMAQAQKDAITIALEGLIHTELD